jgi:geranylgeranyl pyrophosphate synthase
MAPSWDAPIKDDLRQVEEEIYRSVQSREPLLTEIAMHVVKAGGKRMRPGISVLSFRCVGGSEIRKMVQLAAAFELIHSATLVHDDINDGAEMRRGKAAAYKKYGVQRALITGDFLFVKGFRLGGVMEKEEVVEMVADACAAMAESEMLQIDVEHESNAPLETYMRIIQGKTARPIEAGARVGAYIGGGTPEEIEVLGTYGLNIGYAFQIIDDILDINGKEADVGKRCGMDILDSKPNLPLMIAMQGHYPGFERLKEIYGKSVKTWEEVDEALEIVRATDAVDLARNHATDFYKTAVDALKNVRSSPYRDALLALAETIMERKK